MNNPKVDLDYLGSRASKSEQTRLLLIQAGIRCVVQRGFEGTSLSEIGKVAKISRALVVHYFKTKENFYQALADYVSFCGRAFTIQFMETQTSLVDPIERYLRATISWGEKEPELLRFLILGIHRATYDPNYLKWLDETFSIARNRLASLLKDYVRANSRAHLSPDEIRGTAEKIHAGLLGCLISAAGRLPADRPRYSDHAVDLYKEMGLISKKTP